MNNPTRQLHPLGRTEAEDLTILKEAGETGWWDDSGRPAPWPHNFLDPDAGWTNGTGDADELSGEAPENPPF